MESSEAVPSGDAYFYVGVNDRGVELEIIIVPDDKRPGGWAVIHAMPTNYKRSQS